MDSHRYVHKCHPLRFGFFDGLQFVIVADVGDMVQLGVIIQKCKQEIVKGYFTCLFTRANFKTSPFEVSAYLPNICVRLKFDGLVKSRI